MKIRWIKITTVKTYERLCEAYYRLQDHWRDCRFKINDYGMKIKKLERESNDFKIRIQKLEQRNNPRKGEK